MAGKKRAKVRDEDVTGLKYFDQLQPLLKRLHEVGCQRDKASCSLVGRDGVTRRGATGNRNLLGPS